MKTQTPKTVFPECLDKVNIQMGKFYAMLDEIFIQMAIDRTDEMFRDMGK